MILQQDRFDLDFYQVLRLEDDSIVFVRDMTNGHGTPKLCFGKRIKEMIGVCLGIEDAKELIKKYNKYKNTNLSM